MATLQIYDPDGYTIPRWEVALAELAALGVGDPDPEPAFEPSDADWRWLDQNPILPPLDGPTDADWDEMARWCEWCDTKDREALSTDQDIAACGLAVG